MVAFCDQLLPLASEIAARRGLPFTSPDAVRGLRDKSVRRERPMVLKPVHGQGSRSTYLGTDEQVVREICENYFAGAGPHLNAPLVAASYLAGVDRRPFGDYASVESVLYLESEFEFDSDVRTVAAVSVVGGA